MVWSCYFGLLFLGCALVGVMLFNCGVLLEYALRACVLGLIVAALRLDVWFALRLLVGFDYAVLVVGWFICCVWILGGFGYL